MLLRNIEIAALIAKGVNEILLEIRLWLNRQGHIADLLIRKISRTQAGQILAGADPLRIGIICSVINPVFHVAE